MDDGALSLGRWHRLVPRGAAGLSCDETGVALGPVSLIDRIDATGKARYVLRPTVEIARKLGLAYRDMSEAEFDRCLVGLDRIAKAFEHDEAALAMIIAVQLRLPEIDAIGMAKLAAATDLHKYSPDQPRVPAGNPDGGQWASGQEDSQAGTNPTVNPSKTETLTARQVGNIIFNETRSLSGANIDAARNAIAHTIRNGEAEHGAKRPRTAPPKIGAMPLAEAKTYRDCQAAAVKADSERHRGADPTDGTTHFNMTYGISTKPFGGQYKFSYGPFDNSYPYGQVQATKNVYINFFK